jgi:hypothetical protein
MELGFLGRLRFTDNRIKLIKQFIKDGTFPIDTDKDVKKTIRKTYKDNTDFAVKYDKLIYTPKDIEIIPKSQYENALKERYQKQIGIKGIHQFYYFVNQKYFIPRIYTTEFLKKQSDYQLTRTVATKQINKTVVSFYPNGIWEADLMFLTKPEYIKDNPAGDNNDGFQYLLNVIDVFSRKAASVVLNSRDTDVVARAFRQIVQKFGVSPVRLLTDSGSEFNSKDFREMLNQENEKNPNIGKTVLVLGSPYSPTSQAIIERFNGTIRQKIKQLWVKQGNFNYTRNLQNIINEYNNSRHNYHNFTPNELWKPTRTKLMKQTLMKTTQPVLDRKSSKEDKILFTAIEYAKKSETINLDKKEDQVGEDTLPVGTVVRLSQKAYSNKVRGVYKSNVDKKKIAVTYLPTLYKIGKIFKKPSSRQRGMYILEFLDGRPFIPYKSNDIRVKSRTAFFRNELLLVDKDSIPPQSITTQKKANKINIIEDDDDNEVPPPEPTPPPPPKSQLPPRPPKQKKPKKQKVIAPPTLSELEILRQRNLERRRQKSID